MSEDAFALPVSDPQPSQPYLNGRKLALATEWFDFDEPNYDPVPVRRLDGEWVLLDGHTRAFLAALAGAAELAVVESEEDVSVGAYRQCVAWTEAAGVTEVADLFGRALNADAFVEEWVERCEGAFGE